MLHLRNDEPQWPTRIIGNVAIAVLTPETAVNHIDQAIRKRQPLLLAFANAHSVNLANANPKMADVLEKALVLNDGIGVEIGSRLVHGAGFPANLNGTDFTPLLLGALSGSLRIFLLGSPPGVAEQAADAIARSFPQHHIIGTHHGFFAESERERIAARIAADAPDLILVGMGQPIQELWAAQYIVRHGGVVMCIGAYLDFAAGAVVRAPSIFQSLRIEWVFRLAQEPKRLWRRYLLGNFIFMMTVIRQRLSRTAGHR